MAEQRRQQPSSRGRDGAGSGGRGQRASGRPDRGGKPAGAGKSSDKRGGPRRTDQQDRRGAAASKAPRPDRAEPREKVFDGPELPADITGKELDRAVAAQLKSLPDRTQVVVARHLAAAGSLIDSDPELAYQHAKAAKTRAARLAVVREAFGEAAYAAGHYAEALAELRAAKRMNGATAYLPIMADCHRALGQPEQAIKLAHSPSVPNFAADAKAEMTIVEAGARRDLGQFDSALRVLELAPLNSKSRESWVVRLRYAYADTLEAAGRTAEALEWFHRTQAIDGEQITDAAERADALESANEDRS